MTEPRGWTERFHEVALIGFAAMLGLNEGAGQVACAVVLVTTVITGRFRGYRPGPLEIGLIVWLLCGLVGIGLIDMTRKSSDVTRPLTVLSFFIGAVGLKDVSAKTLRRIGWAFGILIVANGAYGYLQYKFGALPLDGLLLKNPVSPQTRMADDWNARLASGLYYNRLKLAHMGVLGLGLIGFTIRTSRGVLRAVLVVSWLVLAGGIALSFTKMAWVAGAAGLLAVIAIRGGRRTRVAVGALAVIAVCATTIFVVMKWDTSVRLEGRRRMLEMGWTMWSEHFLFGVGHGGYRNIAQGMITQHWAPVRLTSPHNLWLQAFCETGLFGGLAFLGTTVLGAARLSVGLDRTEAEAQVGLHTPVIRFAAFSLFVVLVLGLVHSPLHHVPVALAYFCALGVAATVPSAKSAAVSEISGGRAGE